MATPKRKTSVSRIKSRFRSHKKKIVQAKECPQCGAPQEPHRVCPSCGYYRDRQVLTIGVDE